MTTSWHSAHIYYYASDKDALILDAVRPLLRQLRPVVPAAYLVRHWRQGPHLRLHLRTDPHTWTTTVQPQIEHTIGSYLRTHPSTATLDEHAELPTHLLLAEREQENGPLTPWYPDNSIHYLPYDPRLHVFGHQQVADLLTDYLTDSTEPLFAMLEHIRDGADTKELLSLSLMLATSHTLAPPITRSFMSYRSHAEHFLAQSTDPAGTQAAFNRHYHTHHEALTNRVQAVIATLEDRSAGESAPFVRAWAALLQAYADRATPLIQAGLLFPATPAPPPTGPRGPAFFQTLLDNRTYQERILNNLPFNRNRLGLNFTYQHISRLGLSPFQRMRTCHVAANAVEDVYGVSAVNIIKTFIEQHPNQSARAQVLPEAHP
jgi:AcrR family transcriptional regulator